ncbi:sialic acid TRAP transporter permease protein SiaT [Roseovarius sp. A-2]|uniref:TRAP transporter large permease n=1 Tax=Roseobacteraceae TaxID=2854170 RepID=UPI0009B5336C|nr:MULTISPECIES: TRAP transporter large permease subunit [Roseobacteraceae]MDA7430870.1 TRAP transporter large permease subunit [Primorskyibacter aestuariivivens]GAW35413.1 sialic acid TRAP transporter permease protein SiaT [Roseovarius sp. A-2]
MEYLALWMFPVLLLILLTGFPIAFSLMGVATIFGYITFGDTVIYQFIDKIDEVAGNFVLAAVPLFVFMGTMLEKSGIAERLFDAVHIWTRRLPGGLGVGTIFMCVIFAASTGVIGATETVVGLLAIPVMMKHNYNKGLISGTICAGGSLGTIIPPSVVVIIMGPIADVSVGDLFIGMIIPGLTMATLYVIYIIGRCYLRPQDGSLVSDDEYLPTLGERLWITVTAFLPAALMIFAVLGSIMMGLASPTEAAAMGAFGAVILAAVYRTLTWTTLRLALLNTVKVTSMILMILLAGSMFSGVFVGAGGTRVTTELIAASDLSPWATLAVFLIIVFIAGFALEWISILLIFLPVFIPIVTQLGFDPVWFCILFLIVIQTSYLSPPMAPAIFYLRGIAPPEITMPDMFKGVVPFIILQLFTLALVMAFPQMVLWLPEKVLGF